MLHDVDSTPRVKMEDVARTAGVSVATVSKVVNGRYGVAQATLDPRPGGHRRARVRGEPGCAVAAQPPHQRPGHPRGRVRAVQHRAAQGRLLRRRLDRLRAARLLRRRPRRRRRLGAALPVPAVGHPHRRRHHRHPDGRRGQHRRARRGRRPAHRPDRPADRRLRQLRRRGAGHRAPHRAWGTAGSASSADAWTSSPPGCARTASARRWTRPASRSTSPWSPSAGTAPRPPTRRRACCWATPTGPPRCSPRTTSRPSR